MQRPLLFAPKPKDVAHLPPPELNCPPCVGPTFAVTCGAVHALGDDYGHLSRRQGDGEVNPMTSYNNIMVVSPERPQAMPALLPQRGLDPPRRRLSPR